MNFSFYESRAVGRGIFSHFPGAAVYQTRAS